MLLQTALVLNFKFFSFSPSMFHVINFKVLLAGSLSTLAFASLLLLLKTDSARTAVAAAANRSLLPLQKKKNLGIILINIKDKITTDNKTITRLSSAFIKCNLIFLCHVTSPIQMSGPT